MLNQSRATRIHIDKLGLYAQCPRKFQYSLGHCVQPLPQNISIAKRVIQTLATSENTYAGSLTLRAIQELIDTIVFQEVDGLSTEEELEHAYALSQQISTWVMSWYEKMYVPDTFVEAIPNVSLECTTTDHYSIHTDVDLILLRPGISKQVVFVECSDIDMTGPEMYNDFRHQALVYLGWKQLGVVPRIERLFFSERAVFRRTMTVYKPTLFIHKTERNLQQVCNGIQHDIFYLSVSELCSECEFQNSCSF